jgi:hypothetical protein
MFKKKVADSDYSGIPRGLRARAAIRAAKDAEAAVAENDKAKENQVSIHNRLAAEARKTAGIPVVGCNRGISDTGKDRTRGK